MPLALPRVLSVICLICLAGAVPAESRPAPIRNDGGGRTIASVSPQLRRWVSFLRKPRVNHMPQERVRKSASVANDMVLAALLGGGLGLWLLLRIIRFKMRPGRSAPASEENAAMRARGTAALFGALFGCSAGLCIYDKLYPCSSDAPLPPCAPEEKHIERIHTEEHPQEQHAEDRPWQGVGLG